MAVVWVLTAPLAAMWKGAVAVEAVTLAALLCLLPQVAVVLLASLRRRERDPISRLLVSMGLRLAVVLLGTLAICVQRPEMQSVSFALWLAPFYLVALAVETGCELRVTGPSIPAVR